MRSARIVLVISIALLGGVACAISESISTSISSPFEWSAGSSESSSGGDTAYRQDVSDVTLAFAGTDGEIGAFRDRVGSLAAQRGITSWEDDEGTCASIGDGVRRAQLDPEAALVFGERLFGPDSPSLVAYRTGYASVQ